MDVERRELLLWKFLKESKPKEKNRLIFYLKELDDELLKSTGPICALAVVENISTEIVHLDDLKQNDQKWYWLAGGSTGIRWELRVQASA